MSNSYLHDFASWPKALKGPRSGFDLSDKHITTFRPGLLIPVGKRLVMPGDIVKGSPTCPVRALQQFADVPFGEIYADLHVFYVPFRILWKHWEEFEGENKSTAGVRTTEVVLPHMQTYNFKQVLDDEDWNEWETKPDLFDDLVVLTNVGSLESYLGHPVWQADGEAGNTYYGPDLNGLDIIATYRVWNDFFRDINTQAPLAGLDTFYNLASGASFDPSGLFTANIAEIRGTNIDFATGDTLIDHGICLCPPVCKYHDYFTSCLPTPSGQTVYISLGENAPVVADTSMHSTGNNVKLYSSTANNNAGSVVVGGNGNLYFYASSITSTYGMDKTNLMADLSSAQGISINTLRQSIATQLYYETLQAGGNRYIESRKTIWDVYLHNDEIQRPEFLAGSHTLLNIQAVNNTSTANNIAIGKQSANSISYVGGECKYIKHVKEFGYIMTFLSIRYKHTYTGIRRDMMAHRQFDLYNPFFDSIGNTPVYKDELKCAAYTNPGLFLGDDTQQVFGYQEAWADYRSGSVQNRVSGAFDPRAGLSDFAAWTFTDDYSDSTAIPSLSGSWMCEDPSNITRCMVGVTYGPYQFSAAVDNQMIAYRHMKAYSRPSKLGI